MANNQSFAKLVEKAKFSTRMNQGQLAVALGISPQYMSDLVKGRKPKSEEKYALKLAELCGQECGEQNIKQEGLPYYEVDNFECGTPAGFGGALENTQPDGFFDFPGVKNDGETFCVRAHGNSMLNFQDPIHSISHGTYVALRRNDVKAIQWGEVYALATLGGYVIKKLMPSEREGFVKCVSFNADEFPPYDLSVSEIYDYAVVVGVVAINIW